MRAEVFAKDTPSLLSSARLLFGFGGCAGINLPNKARGDGGLQSVQALAEVLTPDELSEVCPHYSLKFNSERRGGADATLARFEQFCQGLVKLNVRRCLLVSGSGERSFDSLACLRAMKLAKARSPLIGVAFNPYHPDRAAREREQARLKLKLSTGRVDAVWLQIGSDTALLEEGLDFIKAVAAERDLALDLHGSVFLPSKRLLAQMKFRPWNGVFLSDEYLRSVERAEAITRELVGIYRRHGVEPLVETAVRTDDEWAAAQRLLASGDAAPRPQREAPSGGDHCECSEEESRPPPSKRPKPASAVPAASAIHPVASAIPDVAAAIPQVAAVPPAVQACAGSASDVAICWFRCHDLRLGDNAALRAASERGAVLPAFIWPQRRGEWSLGGAAQAWLRHCLPSLDAELRTSYGSRLTLRLAGPSPLPASAPTAEVLADAVAAEAEAADTADEVLRLALECGARAVYWSKSYEPEGARVDATVARVLASAGVAASPLPGALLYEPTAVRLPGGFSGGHWGTLMPFVKACERSGPPPARPMQQPARLPLPPSWPRSHTLEGLGLAAPPVRPDGSRGTDWAAAIMTSGGWITTEAAAHEALSAFVDGEGLRGYESRRSRADDPAAVSRLSPYLRFGQLSPRHLYHAVRDAPLDREASKTFARRLHWRDLASFQLHVFPDMATAPIRSHYRDHAWSDDRTALRAWQRGQTGYPMVDAGMRCLYATGWMHQSVRMVAASFLVEYLGISWVEGVRWFHDTLVDADVAINAMMWQNAGRSGIDQWNFVLSPTTGSQDPSGAFCRAWLPELAQLPTKYLHAPWTAPQPVLVAGGVALGDTYPERIVIDLEAARAQTVQALLDARAAHLDRNDAGGYDLIKLPSGETTRVFTKQEFRLSATGQPMPPPPPSSRGGGVSGAGARHGGGGGARGGARGRGGPRGRGGGGASLPASTTRIESYFVKK